MTKAKHIEAAMEALGARIEAHMRSIGCPGEYALFVSINDTGGMGHISNVSRPKMWKGLDQYRGLQEGRVHRIWGEA